LIVAFIIIFLLIFIYTRNRSQNNSSIIRVSGNVEVDDVELSFKIAGRVEARLVSEGETVKSGQTIARLEQNDLVNEVNLQKAVVQSAEAALAELEAGSRPEEIAQAEASVQKAQSRLDELLTGSRPQEIASAEAAVQKAKAEMERLKVEFERRKNLLNENVISTQEYDSAKTAYESAQAVLNEAEENLKLVKEGPRKEQIEQARADLSGAKEHYNLVKKGPRKETINQARARLQQAKESLALAETRLSYATLISPISGLVLSKDIEPGEFIAPGTPVVTVGNLESVWLRAYINETDLGRVKVGQKVRITTDTYPGRIYNGDISFISSEAEFTPKNVQTQKERVKLVYRIKIIIQNSNMELKPGMPADAEISLSKD